MAQDRTELGWRCLCDCGEVKILSTADLKWNGRKSCGCGLGRKKTRETALVGGGLVMSNTLRSLIPERVANLMKNKYRRRADDECPACGYSPARRISMLYGIRSPLFTKVSEDPRNYMVVCELCYERFRKVYGSVPDKLGTPQTWATLILEDGDPDRVRPVKAQLLRPSLELFRNVEPRIEGVAYGMADIHAFALAEKILDEEKGVEP